MARFTRRGRSAGDARKPTGGDEENPGDEGGGRPALPAAPMGRGLDGLRRPPRRDAAYRHPKTGRRRNTSVAARMGGEGLLRNVEARV